MLSKYQIIIDEVIYTQLHLRSNLHTVAPTRSCTSDSYIDLTFFLYYVMWYYIILCDIILYYSISIIISHYTVYGDESSSKTRNSSDIYIRQPRLDSFPLNFSNFPSFLSHVYKYLRFAVIFSHMKLKMWKLISMWKWNSLHMKRHFHNVKFS